MPVPKWERAIAAQELSLTAEALPSEGNPASGQPGSGSAGNPPGGGMVRQGAVTAPAANVQIVLQPPPEIPPLHEIPAPPRDFTGRAEDLRQIVAAVESGAAALFCIHGPAGAGKTTFVLKLAELLTPRYPDAQFYLDLNGAGNRPIEPREAMEHVIRAYHPGADIPESKAGVAGLYHAVLRKQRALLVLENARDRKQVEPLIPPPGSLLLLTSHKQFLVPGIFPKSLDPLLAADARELLIRIAPELANERGGRLNDLARLCSYQPIALRLSGSLLAMRGDVNADIYTSRLQDARQRMRMPAPDAALELSFGLLSPELQKLLFLLAVFPESFNTEAAAAVWGMDPLNARDALDALAAYSLIEYNGTTERYALHEMVRGFAETHANASEHGNADLRYASHYSAVLAEAARLCGEGGPAMKQGLALFDIERGNIQAGQHWAVAHLSQNEIAAELCQDYPGLGMACLTRRLHPREQVRWLEAAVNAAQQVGNPRLEARAQGYLGLAYELLNEFRTAADRYRKSQELARQLNDAPGEARAAAGAGSAQYFLGEFKPALASFETALKLSGKAKDEYGEMIALTGCSNCALALSHFGRAVEYAEKHVKLAQQLSDRSAETIAYGCLSRAHLGLKEFPRAIEFATQQLESSRVCGDRRQEAMALSALGDGFSAQDDYVRAFEFYEQQVLLARETGDREDEAFALWSCAICWCPLGGCEGAIKLGQAALKICEQLELPDTESLRATIEEWRAWLKAHPPEPPAEGQDAAAVKAENAVNAAPSAPGDALAPATDANPSRAAAPHAAAPAEPLAPAAPGAPPPAGAAATAASAAAAIAAAAEPGTAPASAVAQDAAAAQPAPPVGKRRTKRGTSATVSDQGAPAAPVAAAVPGTEAAVAAAQPAPPVAAPRAKRAARPTQPGPRKSSSRK